MVFRALFSSALEREGSVEKALTSLIRAGKIAEIYMGPWVPDSLWASLRGLESSSTAVKVAPSVA